MAIYKRRKKSIAKKSRRSSKSSKRGVTKPRGRARGRGGRQACHTDQEHMVRKGGGQKRIRMAPLNVVKLKGKSNV